MQFEQNPYQLTVPWQFVEPHLSATSVCILASCCEAPAVRISAMWFSSEAPTPLPVPSICEHQYVPRDPRKRRGFSGGPSAVQYIRLVLVGKWLPGGVMGPVSQWLTVPGSNGHISLSSIYDEIINLLDWFEQAIHSNYIELHWFQFTVYFLSQEILGLATPAFLCSRFSQERREVASLA